MSEERFVINELASLRKEVLEMRNLVIKNDNLLRTFHLELANIGKRHEHTAQRHKWSNVAAYVLLSLFGVVGALVYGSAAKRAAEAESRALLERAQETQVKADAAMAAAREHALALEKTQEEASAVWALLTSSNPEKQDEGLERAGRLDQSKLQGFAKEAIGRLSGELRAGRADKAFASGMAEQRVGNIKAARQAFDRFLTLAEPMPPEWRATERLQAHYQLGAACNQLGDHESAVPHLRHFIAHGESVSAKAYAYLLLGDSLEALKNGKAAQEAFRAGLELEPQGVTSSMLRRRVLSEPPT